MRSPLRPSSASPAGGEAPARYHPCVGKLPAIYENVLIIGGGSPPSDGPPVAQVGGSWRRQPDYGLSYLLAAHCLIERGEVEGRQNELAVPVAYLQRHAFEIALKDLLAETRGIKADREYLAELKGDGSARYVAPTEEVPFDHNLDNLIDLLRIALAEIGYDAVPAEFETLAKRMRAVEGADPTRLRYARVRDMAGGLVRRKRSEAPLTSSFPKVVTIPVGETQGQLQHLFEAVLHAEPWTGNSGLGTQLREESEALAQDIYRHDDDPGTPWEPDTEA